MKMQLTKVQSDAVNKLISKYHEGYKQTHFIAPTGSGKTFMIANFIDQMITNSISRNEKLIFVIATISSADLPLQFKNSLINYRRSLFNSNIKISHIEAPSKKAINNNKIDQVYDINFEQNDVIIFGKSSFGTGRIYTEYGVLTKFLQQVKNSRYKLIYIRDEAHIGDKAEGLKDKEKNFEKMVQESADFVIKMSATLETLETENPVIIKEVDLYSDVEKLLKTNKKDLIYDNDELNEKDKISDDDLLNAACRKFKEIKQQYIDTIAEPGLVGINPAMLIQIDNDSKINDEKSKEFQKKLNEIKKTIERNGLTYLVYFGDKNKNNETNLKGVQLDLVNVSQKNSDIDVIIFKIGPSIGWNIPRACMLVQLRSVSSKNLSIQTLGRIKRNPNIAIQNPDSIAFDYWVYSNVKNEDKKDKWCLKDEYKDDSFQYGYIKAEKIDLDKAQKEYYEELDKLLSHQKENQQVSEAVLKAKKPIKKFENKSNFDNYFVFKNEEFKYLIGSFKITNNSSIIIQEYIYDIIGIKLYLDKEFKRKQKFINDSLISKIYNFLGLERKLDLITKFIIYKYFCDCLKVIYENKVKAFQGEINNEIFCISEIKKQLPVYVMNNKSKFYSKLSKDLEQKYAYKALDGKNNYKIYLDSTPEETFLNKIVQLNPKNRIKRIKIISKNPTSDGIWFEYLDNENILRRSFPDFVLRYHNKSTQKFDTLYVEMKSSNDIDCTKTNNIINSYKKYQSSSFKDNNPISLLLCWLDNSNNIKCKGTSQNKQLAKELANNDFVDLNDIFEAFDQE
ncbi:hypothetical protein GE118_00505 [Mycoplasma sp. NEAQ87857]|uniref:DEAD/DEAH box helicase family protein n=1 Tax=Mycoplasma sp. NEAQ87857 TaxID=2683967 RepID=UPI001318E59C|nr:DEAD/DEAH box helicase family protein [Mycoplasma sp. NEAQ87857]QGZ97285.1 hypothetical protein GE118_00505 [Mycoplasma sp. NEAQ87857]